MISVIYGPKGTGKTKSIIDAVNAASEKANGNVIYITDNRESLGVNAGVRFVNVGEYNVKGDKEFVGFIKGMLATDFDIQKVYIDGLSRIISRNAEDLKPVFDAFEAAKGVDFIVTVSTDTLPAFMKAYAKKN